MSRRLPLRGFDAPEPVMKAAAAWLARRDRGFTRAEQHEFEQWRRANPSHAAAVSQLERTLSTFDRLRELRPNDGLPLNPDAFAPPRRAARRVRASIVAMAAAASLAIVLWTAPWRESAETQHFATQGFGYDRASLADGSTVELNADTTLVVEYTRSARHVRLVRGEAHFQVVKDHARPFIVRAENVGIRAVGTAFNVKLADAGVEVLVTEGKVRIAPPALGSKKNSATVHETATAVDVYETPLLTAGHKVIVATTPRAEPIAIAAVSLDEIERALAWQSRVADFKRTPLAAAVAEFNRQNRQQIVIADRELDSLRIGGNFRADQPEAFVRLLEASFGVAATRSGNVITLRKAPESQ